MTRLRIDNKMYSEFNHLLQLNIIFHLKGTSDNLETSIEYFKIFSTTLYVVARITIRTNNNPTNTTDTKTTINTQMQKYTKIRLYASSPPIITKADAYAGSLYALCEMNLVICKKGSSVCMHIDTNSINDLLQNIYLIQNVVINLPLENNILFRSSPKSIPSPLF